jgi:hypothetical protein
MIAWIMAQDLNCAHSRFGGSAHGTPTDSASAFDELPCEVSRMGGDVRNRRGLPV